MSASDRPWRLFEKKQKHSEKIKRTPKEKKRENEQGMVSSLNSRLFWIIGWQTNASIMTERDNFFLATYKNTNEGQRSSPVDSNTTFLKKRNR